MKAIKIIALDMDGVVNSDTHIKEWLLNKKKEYMKSFPHLNPQSDEMNNKIKKAYVHEFVNCEELIFPDLAQIITNIVNKTDCYILWSSTWRKLERYQDIEKAKDMFNRRGLPGNKLIAYTPSIGTGWMGHCRGSEIAAWINNNEEYEIIKCAVIDDRIDAGDNLPACAKFFQTFECFGINNDIANEIIEFLNQKD